MNKYGFILLMVLGISCVTTKKSGMLPEDEFFVTRKYIGNFMDYRHTWPETIGDAHLVWIKTTRDSTYGKISVYSKKCKFSIGDKLYLRRTYCTPGFFGYWRYQIENDSSVFYTLSDFQYDKKILVQTWF
jgi:hypothetical protein